MDVVQCSDDYVLVFFFKDPATTEIYTLSLHDALPIFRFPCARGINAGHERNTTVPERPDKTSGVAPRQSTSVRTEEHTSELQSHVNLVCRLLLEKKKKNTKHVWRRRRIPCTPTRRGHH